MSKKLNRREFVAAGTGTRVFGLRRKAFCRSTANLMSLASLLIVESMRQGMHPKDAGMTALRRIQSQTVISASSTAKAIRISVSISIS